MAVPLRVAAVDLSSTYQEFEEDSEPTEESESDGEQMLFEFCGPQSLRNGQSGTKLFERLPSRTSPDSRRLATPSLFGALRERNGIGGPLRC